jgi:hypothetical protein
MMKVQVIDDANIIRNTTRILMLKDVVVVVGVVSEDTVENIDTVKNVDERSMVTVSRSSDMDVPVDVVIIDNNNTSGFGYRLDLTTVRMDVLLYLDAGLYSPISNATLQKT